MLYRVLIGFLLVVAVALTLNERFQEQRSQNLDNGGLSRPSSGPGTSAAYPSAGPTGPSPTSIVDGPRSAYPAASGPTTGPASAAITPFAPRRVRLTVATDLRALPSAAGPPVQPIGSLAAGVQAMATDRRGEWLLIETPETRGWVRAENVEDA